MKPEGRWLNAFPVLIGILIWIIYDPFVGQATALINAGLLFLPSKRPHTIKNVLVSTLFCVVGFTLIRVFLLKPR